MPELVQIEWEDSVQPVSGWSFLDDAPELEVIKCVSVGWLVSESSEVKMLAPNIGGIDGDAPQGSGFIRIPASAVLRQTNLVEG